MAHHKRVRSTHRKEGKRLDHKKSRQAEDQVLRGDRHRGVRSDNWRMRPDQPPIPDAPSTGKRKKNMRRWCKGKVGVEHKPVYRLWRCFGIHTYYHWICERCGKQLWGYKPPVPPKGAEGDPSADHWTQDNIQRRLAGVPCNCKECAK